MNVAIGLACMQLCASFCHAYIAHPNIHAMKAPMSAPRSVATPFHECVKSTAATITIATAANALNLLEPVAFHTRWPLVGRAAATSTSSWPNLCTKSLKQPLQVCNCRKCSYHDNHLNQYNHDNFNRFNFGNRYKRSLPLLLRHRCRWPRMERAAATSTTCVICTGSLQSLTAHRSTRSW